MDDCVITTSVLGVDCKLKENANITSSILGPSVHIDKNTEVKGQLVQNTSSGECKYRENHKSFFIQHKKFYYVHTKIIHIINLVPIIDVIKNI